MRTSREGWRRTKCGEPLALPVVSYLDDDLVLRLASKGDVSAKVCLFAVLKKASQQSLPRRRFRRHLATLASKHVPLSVYSRQVF